MATIDANPPSGTRDFLPADMALRQWAFATIGEVFRRHGFDPLDTPAFERLDVLTGKYGEEGDQLIFKILRRGEHESSGQADLALRYDLTVPLARVAARYGSQLPTPFKRYQIAPVWRADRPGKGRFREFIQCDLDTVGSTSLTADAATIHAVTDALAALGIEGYTVQLNHRAALRAMIEAYGIGSEREADALVALDKLAKVGVAGVADELRQREIPDVAVAALEADLAAGSDALVERIAATPAGHAALGELGALQDLVGDVSGGQVVHAPVLARGLSYYTGAVFEVVHDDLDATIAAGGRYDGLIGMFQQQDVAATGGSLGLERILLLLESRADVPAAAGPQVVVTIVDEGDAREMLVLAAEVRRAGITVDVFAGTGRLGKQLKYADRRNAQVALIVGRDEVQAGTVSCKVLASGEQQTVVRDDLIKTLRGLLA
ncbi:MAG: histidine--tRNA ligase [Nitriliruptoraceae bacterium]